MTRGTKDGKLLVADGEFVVQDLYRKFLGNSCKSLIGKPKIFFIQACLGKLTDTRTIFTSQSKPEQVENSKNVVIPSNADLLLMYSTAEGYYSSRSPTEGSWFIQALCKALLENKDSELNTVLTKVNRNIASQSELHNNAGFDPETEMPNFTSTFTKGFFFTTKHFENSI